MITESLFLLALTKELQNNPLELRRNDQEQRKLQSSVAIIFRIKPKIASKLSRPFPKIVEKVYGIPNPSRESLAEIIKSDIPIEEENIFEILFLQRQYNKKDRHSGQIALPGGHLDEGETDIEALIREVNEETGIELRNSEETFYLGTIPKNFFLYQKKNADLLLSAHVFLLANSEEVSIKLDLKEIRDHRWVPFNYFIKESQKNRFVFKNVKNLPPSNSKLFNSEYLRKNFLWIEYAGFDIDMDETLWGFTFLLFRFLLTMISSAKEPSMKNSSYIFINKYVQHAVSSKIIFKDFFPLKIPAKLIGNRWVLRNRLDEFAYNKKVGGVGSVTTKISDNRKDLFYKIAFLVFAFTYFISPRLPRL